MGAVPRLYKLLDGNTTVAYGGWFPIGNLVPDSAMIQAEGIVTNDKVQIYISSEDDPTTTEQVQFGSDLTADGQTEFTTPSRWIRAYRSVITGGGTVEVYLSFMELI